LRINVSNKRRKSILDTFQIANEDNISKNSSISEQNEFFEQSPRNVEEGQDHRI